MTIKHYAGAAGFTIIYGLDEKGLEVNTNCDFENCKEKTVYKRTFTKNESDSIYKFLDSLQLDTLQSGYITEGVLDGLYTQLSFKRSFFSSHSTTLDNYNTPATDTLFTFIDNLIPTIKYRFNTWGQDE